MNKLMKKKRSPLHMVLDIVIGVLCVFFVAAMAFTVKSFHEEWGFYYDQESFYYRLEDEAFDSMVEMYYANELSGKKADASTEPYYGVAKYFEAASYYKMYQDAGDEIQMQKYYAQMKKAEEQMGNLNIVTSVIKGKLKFEIK